MSVWNAMTAATHVSLILVAALLVAEIALAVRHPAALQRIGGSAATRYAVYAVAIALALERGYYLVARVVLHRGYNLWAAHPAPEVLSAMVAVNVYAAWVVVMGAASGDRARALRVAASVAAVLLIVWGASVLALLWV